MAAIEFAVKYDDGVGSGLHDADIVLVGVSRTSKTPLSMYLGYLGYKTANVPVVKGIDPPSALFEIDQTKIVGLTIGAERLAEIRQDRARRLGGGNGKYAALVEIYEELDYAAEIHRKLGCPVIEMTDLVDRGDGGADHPARRAASGRGHGPELCGGATAARGSRLWRWALWWAMLMLADLVFYVLLTPLWLGGRGLAWVAEWRARRRRGPSTHRQFLTVS